MTGVFRLPLFQRTFQFTPNVQGGSPLSATVFGVSFAIGWTPCIGPILGAILMATSNAASAQAGMIYLSAYSAGLALPFLASTLLINRFALHRQSLGRWSAYARPVAGTIVILMGIAIVTGYMTRLSSIMVDLFPSLATLG
ncbi:cytochrome c biogenesis CcdA family protein, partial [Halomonas sp. MES3-P3E]